MVFHKINMETLILQGPVFFFIYENKQLVNLLKWDVVFA